MKLYEVNQLLSNFEFTFDEETGEILNLDDYQALNVERNEKLENLALACKYIDYDINALKQEKKSLDERIISKQKKLESLKTFLSKELDFNKLETPKVLVKFRKSSSVVVDDEEAFLNSMNNEAYINIKTTKSINKKALKEALKTEKVEGASLIEKQNISIK